VVLDEDVANAEVYGADMSTSVPREGNLERNAFLHREIRNKTLEQNRACSLGCRTEADRGGGVGKGTAVVWKYEMLYLVTKYGSFTLRTVFLLLISTIPARAMPNLMLRIVVSESIPARRVTTGRTMTFFARWSHETSAICEGSR
jgi:hypothetical protein